MSRKKTVCSVILRVVSYLLIAVLLLLLLRVFIAKVKGEVPTIFGFGVLRIISGSMEDEIPTGTYILVKKCDPTEVKAGDIISFYSDDSYISGLPNTHRVVRVVGEGETIEFVTKGDANDLEDQVTAKGNRLIGRYVKNIDFLGAVAKLMSGKGMIVAVVVLQVFCIGMVVSTIAIKRNEKKKPKD